MQGFLGERGKSDGAAALTGPKLHTPGKDPGDAVGDNEVTVSLEP